MSQIKFGCQFYTWQMSGERYVGKLPHILEIVKSAGFSGIEPETCMLGGYYEDIPGMQAVLARHGMQLAAIALVCDWSGPAESEAERQDAERVFRYLEAFPDTHLVLCQMPGKDRSDLHQRQENLIACANAVASRANALGIACSFHPNSPPGSIFRTREDYQILLDGLDSQVVGFAPDSGHIAKGGMDVLEVFETYLPLVRHVHFKDIDVSGGWTAMGAGVIDFPSIVRLLKDAGFAGWIMVEEESPQAEVDPDGATLKNGEYLRKALLPLVQE